MHIYDVCLYVLVSLCTGSRDDAMMRCRQFFFCQWVAIRCCVLQDNAKCCSVIWPTDASVRDRTLQHAAAHCNTLQHTATRCNTLQHTAAHCNMLQHTATHCNTLRRLHDARARDLANCNTVVTWHHTAAHCNILQHTTTYWNTLQITSMHYGDETIAWGESTWSHTATECSNCNTLQHNVTRCNILSTQCNICAQKAPTHCNRMHHTVTQQCTATCCNTATHY